MSKAAPGHGESITSHRQGWSVRLGWTAMAIVTIAVIVVSIRWRVAAGATSLPPEFFEAWESLEALRIDEVEKTIDGLMRQRQYGSAYLVLDASLYLIRRDFDAAEARIQASNASGALRPYALELLGRNYYWRNQWYHAEQTFATLAQEFPRSFAAHLWLGVIYHDSHMFGQAMHELQLAAEIQPDNPRSHILQASILYRYGRYQKAAEEYQRALRLIPSNTESDVSSGGPVLTYLVRCLVRDGQFEKGLNQIAALSNPSVELQILRAECFLGLGQLAEAERECRIALERDENQQAAVIALVKVGMQQAVTPEHAQLLEAVFDTNPNDPDVTFLLAQVHGRLGNQPRQQELLSQSQRLLKFRSRSLELMDVIWSQPEDVDSRLKLASIFDEMGDSAQAKQWRQAAASCQHRVKSIKEIQR